MTNIILHGCNGKMGKTIAGLIEEDREIAIAAGVDASDDEKNPFPVFKNISECDVKADVVIDFSVAAAMDGLLSWCMEKEIPCVLCTTGLSDEQLEMVKKLSEKTAVLKSANMSLGINMLMKLLKRGGGDFKACRF